MCNSSLPNVGSESEELCCCHSVDTMSSSYSRISDNLVQHRHLHCRHLNLVWMSPARIEFKHLECLLLRDGDTGSSALTPPSWLWPADIGLLCFCYCLLSLVDILWLIWKSVTAAVINFSNSGVWLNSISFSASPKQILKACWKWWHSP